MAYQESSSTPISDSYAGDLQDNGAFEKDGFQIEFKGGYYPVIHSKWLLIIAFSHISVA